MRERSLEDLRKQIDSIDEHLVALLNQRAALVQEIGAIKAKCEVSCHDPEREQKILKKIAEGNRGPFPTERLLDLFRQIFRISIGLEQRK